MLQRRNELSRKWLLIALWLHICFLAFAVVEASFALGPIRLFPGRHSFVWQAAVDTPTGIATSKEILQASPRSSIVRHFQQEKDVWADVINRLERYPEWVVRGAVTFGLFHAVPVQEGCYSLQDRFFGINFLTFGVPRIQRFSFLETQPTQESGLKVERGAGDCTVKLPIVGGLLALSKQSRGNEMGCLKFTLKHNEDDSETKLITEIQGYSPLLVGPTEPAPFYRKCLYLFTQSLIHAYVMWRFQRHCLYSNY